VSAPAAFDYVDGVYATLLAMASTTWTVYNGNSPAGDVPQTYIVVGASEAGDVLSLSQEWHGIGYQADRSEAGILRCVVASWDGDATLTATVRNRIRDALADLASAIQQTATTAGIEGHITNVALASAEASSGVQYRADVELSYTALLTTWP